MSQSIAIPQELTAEQARRRADLSAVAFRTTADLEPLITMVGQERAVQALHLGLGVPQQGYNIFVSVLAGSGARAQVEGLLHEKPLPCQHRVTGCMYRIFAHPINPRRFL